MAVDGCQGIQRVRLGLVQPVNFSVGSGKRHLELRVPRPSRHVPDAALVAPGSIRLAARPVTGNQTVA